MPAQLIDPVTQTATQNITSGAGNLTNLELERMRQAGESARQGAMIDADAQRQALDHEFQSNLVDKQHAFTTSEREGGQQFDAEQAGVQHTRNLETIGAQGQQNKELADLHNKFQTKLIDIANRKEALQTRYAQHLNDARLDEAEKLIPDMEATQKELHDNEDEFSRATLAMGLLEQGLGAHLGEIQKSTDNMAVGMNKLHNQIRESITAGVGDAFTEGLTTDSLKDFLHTTKFTSDGGRSTAASAVGQQLIDSFVNGPGMSKVLELAQPASPDQAAAQVRNILTAAVSVASGMGQGRVSGDQMGQLKAAVDQAKTQLDESTIDTILSSFSDAFNGASTGFSFADLKTRLTGQKVKPEAEAELKKVFNVFGKVGQLRAPLGLTSAEKRTKSLQNTIPETLMRLEKLSPQLIEQALAGLPAEAAGELRIAMQRVQKEYAEKEAAKGQVQGIQKRSRDLTDKLLHTRSQIGRKNPKAESATEEYLTKLLEPTQ